MSVVVVLSSLLAVAKFARLFRIPNSQMSHPSESNKSRNDLHFLYNYIFDIFIFKILLIYYYSKHQAHKN
jgi:hypothetical protein